mgnify:CR=1 FL=1
MGRAFEYRRAAKEKRWDKMSKVFPKLSRAITVAAKEGGLDPEMNSKLRAAIQNAKSQNMPKDNIERAIDKSSVSAGLNFENLRYEGFGPEKVAVIVETLTDNKNRTASNIRTIFQKAGGSLGTQGSASHNFNQLGVIKIAKGEISEEEILELAIEAGADECKTHNSFYEIHSSKNTIYNIKKVLEKKLQNFISTEIEWLPVNDIIIPKDKAADLINFFELLDNDDDIQNFYSNAKFIE